MDIEAEAKQFLADLKKIKKEVSAVATKDGQVNSAKLRGDVERLCKYWFKTLKGQLTSGFSFSDDVDAIKSRNEALSHLLSLSASHGNKKKQYLRDLCTVILRFQTEIIHVIQTEGIQSGTAIDATFDTLLTGITNQDQNVYLLEAVNCAKAGFLKASVVLGWCACMDHIHKKIDELGYPLFNVTTAQIASQQKGRFKNFNKTYNITSVSELREVFDKDILTILEGMRLIDFNQGTRLKSCFDMRNHSGHPGDAPITPYNVMSFFSDISEIVLTNKQFELASAKQGI